MFIITLKEKNNAIINIIVAKIVMVLYNLRLIIITDY